MLKQKKSIVVMTKVLVMALLIGVFAAIPSAETFAAANKALRTKVTFNGDKESDEAWMNNNYVMQAGYKKASKIKKNMTALLRLNGCFFAMENGSVFRIQFDIVLINFLLEIRNKTIDIEPSKDASETSQ